MRIAIIGAGISGLSAARLLQDSHTVKVFEKESVPGGLIRCQRVDGSLFHLCGGHIFNTRKPAVLQWFWQHFKEEEFVKRDRNSVIWFDGGKIVPYPVENYVYLLDEGTQKEVIADFLEMAREGVQEADNFEDFLKYRFGKTLYGLYFRPYNEKVWMRDLRQVPLSWLEGKLPMPTVTEMIYNNMNHVAERQFVHSSFWYERQGGSQFLADRLAEGLDIAYGAEISAIERRGEAWWIRDEAFDRVVFCGNVKAMVEMVKGLDIRPYVPAVERLESHGTTAVFCEVAENPYTWVYQPSRAYRSHRIICTGNFSASNNAPGKNTATIEFTDAIGEKEIREQLQKMPFSPRYITHHYSAYSYPIQDVATRALIRSLKEALKPYGFFFTGRFADWEYYNMDVAIAAAMDTVAAMETD